MTFAEIGNMINGTGLANVYDHFTTSPPPPYAVFYLPNQNDFFADDSNYCGRSNLTVELFAKSRDFESESALENAFRGNGLAWVKSVDFLNDELIYQTTYEMEVILNG